jgi:hypothetical protein
MLTVHKVSWLAATYCPRLPDGMRQWHFVDFVPRTVAGQRRISTGFLFLNSLFRLTMSHGSNRHAD